MSIGPVNWGSYGPMTLERVMSVLVFQDHPLTIRRTPASGDGGVDLMIPLGDDYEVKQVKGFTGRMDPGRKRQVEASLATAASDPRLPGNSAIAEWKLTVPIDPTPDEQEWFEAMRSAAPFDCHWEGLPFWDGLAARHPYVIDYYLRDGRERIEKHAAALLDAVSPHLAPLTAGDVAGHLARLRQLLNETDPHYRYEFETGAEFPPPSRSDVVMTHSRSMEDGGHLHVHVYAKHRYSLEERPIQGTMTIRVVDEDAGVDLRQAAEDFRKYGTGFDIPLGSVDIEMDAPSGLGGEFLGAAASLGPRRSVPTVEAFRIRARNPDTGEASTVRMNIETSTRGEEGFKATLVDPHGYLRIGLTMDWSGDSAGHFELNFKSQAVVGAPVDDVLDVVRFLAGLQGPNFVELMPLHGEKVMAAAEVPWMAGRLGDQALQMVEDLHVLQTRVSDVVVIPQVVTQQSQQQLRLAAHLLRKKTVEASQVVFEVAIPEAETPEDYVEKINEAGGQVVVEHSMKVEFPGVTYDTDVLVYMIGKTIERASNAESDAGLTSMLLKNGSEPVILTLDPPPSATEELPS